MTGIVRPADCHGCERCDRRRRYDLSEAWPTVVSTGAVVGGSMTPPVPLAGAVDGNSRRRRVELDALRGVAMVLMLVDHVAVVIGPGAVTLRETLGRLAMPLFFLLGGHLARRRSWRLLQVVGTGVVVGALVPWSGAAALLAWFAVGVLLLATAGRAGAVFVVLCSLTAFANPSVFEPYALAGTGYPPHALLALMALGRLVDVDQLVRLGSLLGQGRLRAWLAGLGRWPLTFYAVHLFALSALATAGR